MKIKRLHHVAIIASNYKASKDFYTQTLGLKILAEVYRSERDSWKLDLEINGVYQIELFSFPNPPPRVTKPEAAGLRHLAFAVKDVQTTIEELRSKGVEVENVRTDEYTGKRFAFFFDPDGLPLEIYEA